MQVCTSLQTDNHASTSPLSFFTGRMPFLPPNQQRQSTEGICPLMNKVENINCGLVWACVRITPKISPFALWDLGHHLTHGYLGPQKSTLQTASWSIQPPVTSEVMTLWRYTNLFIIITDTHRQTDHTKMHNYTCNSFLCYAMRPKNIEFRD